MPATHPDASRVFTLAHPQGLRIQVSALGATWLSCRVPLPGMASREVLLAHQHPAQHALQPGYLGGIVGRFANRIDGACFEHQGQLHRLAANEGPHQLHGGPMGFNRRQWQVLQAGPQALTLSLHSPDGDQGYPGELTVQAHYSLPDARTVQLHLQATCSAPCPVSLTSHAYFNLDGAAPGQPLASVSGHGLQLRASQYLPVRDDLIPTGQVLPVTGTALHRPSLQAIGQQPIDHCVLLDGPPDTPVPAARLCSSDGLLQMSLHTNYPALQVYTGQWLHQNTDRQGQPFVPHAGVALEAQFLPDTPNHPEWARQHGGWLLPGQRLDRVIRWVFDAVGAAADRR